MGVGIKIKNCAAILDGERSEVKGQIAEVKPVTVVVGVNFCNLTSNL
jgi:hypothetical protein